jgi:hypothetical protein
MGSACTSAKKTGVIIPTNVMRVRENKLSSPEKLNDNVEDKDALSLPNEERTAIAALPSNKAKEEEMKNNKEVSEKDLLLKYGISTLGIGEFYLEKEMNGVSNSKWEKAISHMTAKYSDDSQEDTFYYGMGLSLRKYSAANQKSYLKLLKEGPPMKYRWSIWKNNLNLNKYYVPGLYGRLIRQSSSWENDIQKDIPRTFPEEAYFSSEQYNHFGQEQLGRVLKAISLYFPNIGYCQGMSFLVGFLLLVSGGKEMETFWAFVTLARDVKFLVMGFFEKDFPLLELYMHIFYELLLVKMPNLYTHLKSQLIPDQLWLLKWFLTLFLINFPASQAIRIWDFIMQEGLLGLIKIALSLAKVLEKDMLGLDIAGLNQLFTDLRENHSKSNPEKLNKSDQANKKNPENVGNGGAEGENLQEKAEKNVNTNKSHKEASGVQYHFRELNIEKVIKNARKIIISSKKLTGMTKNFSEKTGKTLPTMYEKFFLDYNGYLKENQKQIEAQNEIDSILVRPSNLKISSEAAGSKVIVDIVPDSHINESIPL